MKLSLVIALTLAAGSAYAGCVLSVVSPVGSTSFSPSNNVSIGVTSDAKGYSANSKHSSGDRYVGFVNTDSKLYYFSGAAIGAQASAPAATDTYSNISSTTGWLSM
jgi:hypothetical protein